MVDDIQTGNKYGPNHINVGIIGTTFMFDTLTKYGRADVAIATLLNVSSQQAVHKQSTLLGMYGWMFTNCLWLQDTYPSFGYMVSQGAFTTGNMQLRVLPWSVLTDCL